MHRNLSSNPSNHVKEKNENNLAMGMHAYNLNTVCLGHWAAHLAPNSMRDPVPKNKVECDRTGHQVSFSNLHPCMLIHLYVLYTYTLYLQEYTQA